MQLYMDIMNQVAISMGLLNVQLLQMSCAVRYGGGWFSNTKIKFRKNFWKLFSSSVDTQLRSRKQDNDSRL